MKLCDARSVANFIARKQKTGETEVSPVVASTAFRPLPMGIGYANQRLG
jgi:hypothetical protein